jgi:type IV secretory pathway TrbL component
LNNTVSSANATMSELGKNASNTGETILNQTGEVAKKIVGGAANVLSNISGEIKEGVGDK